MRKCVLFALRHSLFALALLSPPVARASPLAIVVPAPANPGTSNVISESSNYSLTGSETSVEVNASSASVIITATPATIAGLKPIRIKKIDTSANTVIVTDGSNACIVLITAANSRGQGGGWADVSSNASNLRCEGVN